MTSIWHTAKGAYMLFGMLFALLAIVLIAIFGDQTMRAYGVSAVILLAVSQFAAQDGNRLARIVNFSGAYLAVLFMILAVWRMYNTIPLPVP